MYIFYEPAAYRAERKRIHHRNVEGRQALKTHWDDYITYLAATYSDQMVIDYDNDQTDYTTSYDNNIDTDNDHDIELDWDSAEVIDFWRWHTSHVAECKLGC